MLNGSKIKPFLWFDTQAEEAAKFYTSIFRNSKVGKVARYPEGSPGPAGKVMTVEFTLEGRLVPAEMGKLFSDAKKAERVMKAMLSMVKLDIRKLKEAAK